MAAFNEYSERFLEIIDELEYSDYKVWNEVKSLSKATMSKIRRGICGISMNALCDFIEQYPEVNADYIITGRGDKWIGTIIEDSEVVVKFRNQEFQIAKLKEDLRDAYAEIGELRMKLKSYEDNSLAQNVG